jgi:hypothetical protein
MPEVTLCSRCIYSSQITGISFDINGVCNFCRQIDVLSLKFGTGLPAGELAWNNIVKEIKRAGRKRKYDCVIGVSGGTDSSYLLLLAKRYGLRPLAVHYDNTWNSAQAAMNIRRVTTTFDIDLWTYVVNNSEVDDIKKSFLLAGVREFDADTDIGYVQVLRSTAAKYKVSYILEGHSFIAEGLSPAGDNYLDGGYVHDVHKRFGKLKPKTFPNLTFFRFLKWTLLFRQKFIRPLWYLSYSKEAAKEDLISTTGWKDYGGHHLENRASAFAHKIYLPQRFGIDYRFLTLAAKVRAGLLTRQDALRAWNIPLGDDLELRKYVCARLGISEIELRDIMALPTRTWRDFKTYKRRFEILRPLFFVLAKKKRVPQSFYEKYCIPAKRQA